MLRTSKSYFYFINEARKALCMAHTAREQGDTKAADMALAHAAEARKALLSQCVTIPLARELWNTGDKIRRHALAAHLLNNLKAHPHPVSQEAGIVLDGFY